jgi:hypothetical protein
MTVGIRLLWGREEIPRYPPFLRGLPAVRAHQVVATQTELIARIRHVAALGKAEFERLVAPCISAYAAFVHLLPASSAHHHRGAGGLFRHGLEVAFLAGQSVDGVVFVTEGFPGERKTLEPRWRLATLLAGLFHDVGKPVSDLAVTDQDGATLWNPYRESLEGWLRRKGVRRYFLHWREDRHRRHESHGVAVTGHLMPRESLAWLTEGRPVIAQAMLDAIAGAAGKDNTVAQLVLQADCASVESDLKTWRDITGDHGIGVPVERYVLDAMRTLIRRGPWRVNQPGARVWHLAEGCFVVWPAGARDVGEYVSRERIPGAPRDPDTLADVLIERGLADSFVAADGARHRYWPIQPDVLAAGGQVMRLYALRLAAPDILFDAAPARVAGGVVRESPSNAVPELRTEQAGAGQAEEEADVGEHTDADPVARMGGANAPDEVPLRTREVAEGSSPSGIPEEEAGSAAVLLPAADAEASVAAWLEAQGPAGAVLKALAEDLRDGRKRLGEDARMVGHCLALRYPDTVSGYGVEPGRVRDLFAELAWLEPDPTAPRRKLRVVDGMRALVLAPDLTRRLLVIPALARAGEGAD